MGTIFVNLNPLRFSLIPEDSRRHGGMAQPTISNTCATMGSYQLKGSGFCRLTCILYIYTHIIVKAQKPGSNDGGLWAPGEIVVVSPNLRQRSIY